MSSWAQDEPPPEQLARSTGSYPGIPILRDEELTYPRLKALLQSKSHVDRYAGADNLARTSNLGWKGTREEADELATLALRDPYWAVRYAGAKFAYFRAGEGAGMIPALVAALDSEEPLVRGQVALALERTGGVDQALPRLRAMLAAADQPLAVATALAQTEAGHRVLGELTSSTNATTRLFSRAGLIKGGNTAPGIVEGYLEGVRTALGAKEAAAATLACTSVELAGNAAAGAGMEMAALLSRSEIDVRIAAASALLQSVPKDAAVVSALIAALDDKQISGRCVVALGRIGEPARPAIPALIKLMEQDPTSRFSVVVYAFPFIDPQSPEVLAALLKALKASNAEKRPDDHVIEALGGYGPAAQAAVPDLMASLEIKGGDPYYIPAAIWTLGQIGPAAAAARPKVEEYARGPFRELGATALQRIAPADPANVPPPQPKYPGPGVKF